MSDAEIRRERDFLRELNTAKMYGIRKELENFISRYALILGMQYQGRDVPTILHEYHYKENEEDRWQSHFANMAQLIATTRFTSVTDIYVFLEKIDYLLHQVSLLDSDPEPLHLLYELLYQCYADIHSLVSEFRNPMVGLFE